MREKQLQDQCVDYLTERGIYHVVTHGNAFERRGRPDIYLCYRGRFVGVELKKGSEETPTPLQMKHLREIRESGGIGEWITSLEELKSLLSSIDSTPS
jgi:penicillin-binding protein-related factor A (putative recombinase)